MVWRRLLSLVRSSLAGSPSCLILGDNIFHGGGLQDLLANCMQRIEGSTVFGYWVRDPERYGVVEFDDSKMRVISLEEKPSTAFKLCGNRLVFYDGRASQFARNLKPSPRGELEITDLNRRYLEDGSLRLERLGRGYAWLDTGTHESLQQASSFIETIETRQGLKVACPEEIAFIHGWIDQQRVMQLAEPLRNSGYGEYLVQLLERGLNG